MQESARERLEGGVLGRFAILGSDPFGPSGVPGHLAISVDGYVRLSLFQQGASDDVPSAETSSGTVTMVGFTELAGVILPDLSRTSISQLFASRHAAAIRMRGRSVWVGAHSGADSERVAAAGYSFTGIEGWHMLSAIEEDWELHDEHAEVHLRLHRHDAQAEMTGGINVQMQVGPTHRAASALTFRPVTTFQVVPTKPDGATTVQVLRHWQDLLSLAYQKPVMAESGFVCSPNQGDFATLWDRAAMTSPQGGASGQLKPSDRPIFTLADMGGIEGVANWLALCERHWRATGTITSRYRHGPGLLENDLMSVCSGIEYWAKFNPGGWAGRKGSYAQDLVEALGPEAAEWVGGAKHFGKALWDLNNLLKHSNSEYDVQVMYYLCEAARILLLASVLHEVEPQSDFLSKMLAHSNVRPIGDGLRESLQ